MNPSLRGDFYRASIFAKLQVFALGMAAYRIYRQWIAPRPMPATLGWVLMLAAALIFYAWINNALPVLFFAPADDAPGYFNVKSAHGMLWQSSFYICLVLGLAIHSSPLVVNWLTLFCGRMSFSIYLLNPLVIIVLRPWLGAIAANHLPVSVTFILDLALVSGVLLPASWLTYTLIERPGMHLGNRIAARV
jgi:peptidoglycan/LPS O-acetylase OafA/YrhL